MTDRAQQANRTAGSAAPLPAAQVFRRVGVLSVGLYRLPHLRAFLGAESIVPVPLAAAQVDCVAGWGHRPSGQRARRHARRLGVPFLALEDGFVRSLASGATGAPPLSIVVDTLGIYYDAGAPSALEARIANAVAPDPALLARAAAAMARLRAERLSKYNDAPQTALGPRTRPRVLVVDQTAGDQSIRHGGAGAAAFPRMLAAALADHPQAEIIVKTHPDVALGRRRGHLGAAAGDPRVRLLAAPANPMVLLEQVDRVYVVTSLLGFEALVAGLPVTCFGVPFYAGWGLTDDRIPPPTRRGRARSLERVFAEAYLGYARYIDPETGARCELERVLDHLALQRRARAAAPRRSVCIGFSRWKRTFVPAFLGSPEVTFADDARAAAAQLQGDAQLVVWGDRADAAVRALATRRGLPVVRVEDGFLRSVGLGAELHAPASLVVDGEGLYYDPATPSALERILEARDFTADELARARVLRERIVELGLSKYNVGARRAVGSRRRDRPVVLVVGQVEDDASVELGCLDVRTNLDLLRAARQARPDAHVIWKPHPDVARGLRRGAVPAAAWRRLADEVVADGSIADCLAAADEVHTMTSLAGFEALLRAKRVVVYGQPFYAGWGLTDDRHPHPRRTQRLTLDELVAGTLIRYPRYVSAASGTLTTPERVVEELCAARGAPATATRRLAGWTRRRLAQARGLAATAWRHQRAAPPPGRALPDWGVTHALLLQGPPGPFLARFGAELRAQGLRTTKINFHGGDALFHRGADTIAFRGRPDEWRAFVGDVIATRGCDGVFLFGDCREHHRVAIEVARARGLAVWVFEEGYLRPDWITLERDGVNGFSRLPRDPDVYRRAGLPPPPPPAPVGRTFGRMAWYASSYALAHALGRRRYPHYRHHRTLDLRFHACAWLRGAARKLWYRWREAPLLGRLTGERSQRYFLVALQTHGDAQLRHSPYGEVRDFIDDVVATFAAHGDPADALVFKHHPLDRPFREYGPLLHSLATRHDLNGRLLSVHDLHLPTLLRHARGCITINSTAGLQALHHGTPVKAMGTAVYDLPGLAHQGTLADFLRAPGCVDAALWGAFRRWLLWHNQFNGSFYARRGGGRRGTGVRWALQPAPLAPPPVPDPAGRRRRKLAKLRTAPGQFCADAADPLTRVLGGVLARRVERSALAMSLLEDPLAACRSRAPALVARALDAAARRRARTRAARLGAAGMPVVSVIVAARNAAATVERSLRSLLSQTYQPLEIVVLDDASTDATGEIAARLAATDGRVRLLRNARPRGAAGARNAGLARATGAYLTFQDADDVSHPERIERQLAALLGRPDAAVCVCNFRRETEAGVRVTVNGRRFARCPLSMLFPREPVFTALGYLSSLAVGEDSEYHQRIRTVFGADSEVHLFETLYRARYAPDSLLFSHGTVTTEAPHRIRHTPCERMRIAAADAGARLDAVRRGDASPYVAFDG